MCSVAGTTFMKAAMRSFSSALAVVDSHLEKTRSFILDARKSWRVTVDRPFTRRRRSCVTGVSTAAKRGCSSVVNRGEEGGKQRERDALAWALLRSARRASQLLPILRDSSQSVLASCSASNACASDWRSMVDCSAM